MRPKAGHEAAVHERAVTYRSRPDKMDRDTDWGSYATLSPSCTIGTAPLSTKNRMRNIIKCLAVLTLIAANTDCLANDRATFPSAEKCKGAADNREVTECLGSVAAALEPLVEKYFEAKRSDIHKSETGESELFKQQLENAISSLESAQSSWKSYRDAQCEMVADLYLNGSGRGAGWAQCMIDLTTLRIRELVAYGSGLPTPH
jgi:uncharacterized protein YecT (DUF1311 family)